MYLAELVDFEKMDKSQVVQLCIVLFELLNNKQAVPVAYPVAYPTNPPAPLYQTWPTITCNSTPDIK